MVSLSLVLILLLCGLVAVPVAKALRVGVRGYALGPQGRRIRWQLMAAALMLGLAVILREPTGLAHYLLPLVAALVVAGAAIINPHLDQAPDGRRQVDLAPRSPWKIIPVWAYALPGAGLVVMICATLFFGFTSAPNEQGQYRDLAAKLAYSSAGSTDFTQVDLGLITTRYPGWYVGIPVLIATVLVVASTIAALYRIIGQPLRGSDQVRASARRRRAAYSLIVLAQSCAGLMLSAGLMFINAGALTGNLATSMQWSRESGGVAHDFPVLVGLAVVEYGAGFIVMSLALVVLHSAWSLTRPARKLVGATGVEPAGITDGLSPGNVLEGAGQEPGRNPGMSHHVSD